MRLVLIVISVIFTVGFLSCSKKTDNAITPWGSSISEDGKPVVDNADDTLSHHKGNNISLDDIIANGELIVMTVSSPETYYDFHGHGMGTQYMICEQFVKKIGVSLRVEVCADSAEAVKRVMDGEGDIAVFADFKDWIVGESDGRLSSELKSWYKPEMVEQARNEQKSLLAHGYVKRRVYPYMLNHQGGVISSYDQWFRLYAPEARLDWTLLAAQCYQESCFDPHAHSWAGACGLMQIMPATADALGLPRDKIYNPEDNIHAAVRYMAKLQNQFSDIRDQQQRLRFCLAAYNAGPQHVRDAMALARKYNKNPYSWSDVREYILALQNPEYYKDPVVKRGYMRGSETAAYVDKIMQRWQLYRGSGVSGMSNFRSPQPAKGNNKYSQ